MQRRYATVDVFTTRLFAGNPLAVVLDAEGLTDAQMQSMATEFNYSETTFVLPPRDPAHTAHIRIFTPAREIPFAGHPNVGTAFVLAQQTLGRGEALPDRFVFEEAAGLVPMTFLRDGNAVVGAELTSPQPLSRGGTAAAGPVAAILSLPEGDIVATAHPPQVVSVGTPFLVVELASRDALRRIRPVAALYDTILPLDGAAAIYAYTQDGGADDPATDVQARMFMLGLTTEDPATGSATAAVTALLAELRGVEEISLRVGQGVDMGRPSLLLMRARTGTGGTVAYAGGYCVGVFEGRFQL